MCEAAPVLEAIEIGKTVVDGARRRRNFQRSAHIKAILKERKKFAATRGKRRQSRCDGFNRPCRCTRRQRKVVDGSNLGHMVEEEEEEEEKEQVEVASMASRRREVRRRYRRVGAR